MNPAVPAKNLQELIALARKEKLSYASSGIGTTTHLSVERIKMAAKIDITHVPYQPAQAAGAAVGGHTQISSTSMPPAVTHVRAGRLRAIAVTSAQRSPALPDVPTVNEQGFSGFDDLTWTAVFAPAGTPQDIVNRLNSELNRALSSPDVLERLGQLGLDWKQQHLGRVRRVPARGGAEVGEGGQGLGREGRLGMAPPFRADQVGSLLRPAGMTKDKWSRQEAIREVVAKQEAIGLRGDHRRRVQPRLVAPRLPRAARGRDARAGGRPGAEVRRHDGPAAGAACHRQAGLFATDHGR